MSTTGPEKARNQQIKELADSVTTADRNYRIWWIYLNPEDLKKYRETLNDSPLFFKAGFHAHFLTTVVALYALYETRHDTVNIPRILSGASQEVKTDLAPKLTEVKALWKKVGILRNECFAHVCFRLSTNAVLKKADLCPNDLRRLIELYKEIVNHLSRAEGRFSRTFVDPSGETRNILNQLKKYMNSRHVGVLSVVARDKSS